MDPMTAMMLASVGMDALGVGSPPQVGAAPPPPQPQGQGGLLFNRPSDDLADRLAALNQPVGNEVQKAMAGSTNANVGPTKLAALSQNAQPEAAGPSGLGAFFGNLDSNLQRPSMQLGLGLLGRAHPAAPYLGLLAQGLYGDNKVF